MWPDATELSDTLSWTDKVTQRLRALLGLAPLQRSQAEVFFMPVQAFTTCS